jgi:hypothetical protein
LPDDDYQIELNNSQLIALLNKANSLFIEANFVQHNLRFPLYLAHDMPDVISPRLGIPEIYEHATAGQRLWRLDNPTDLELLNSNGETLPFEIINISVSGLLIRDHMLTLNLGERFDGILSGFGIYIPLTGILIISNGNVSPLLFSNSKSVGLSNRQSRCPAVACSYISGMPRRGEITSGISCAR